MHGNIVPRYYLIKIGQFCEKSKTIAKSRFYCDSVRYDSRLATTSHATRGSTWNQRSNNNIGRKVRLLVKLCGTRKSKYVRKVAHRVITWQDKYRARLGFTPSDHQNVTVRER